MVTLLTCGLQTPARAGRARPRPRPLGRALEKGSARPHIDLHAKLCYGDSPVGHRCGPILAA
eukprot:5124479-Pyramimonas_sp.AAC.1